MKERIARSVFWMVWSRALVQAVSFLSALVVARLLDPADYGLMALATIWTSTLALVAEVGLVGAIIQFPDMEEGELNLCFWMSLAAASVGYAGLSALAPAIGSWFSTPGLTPVLRTAGLVLPLTALRVVPEGMLRKRLEIDRISQAEMAAVLVTLPVVLIMAWRGAGVWALVAGALAAQAVQLVATFRLLRWWPGLRLRSRRLGAILRYGLSAVGNKACWAACEEVDTVVLGRVAGGSPILGLYSMAKSLASLPVVKIAVLVNQLASPVMAGFQRDPDLLRASFMRGLRVVASLSAPMCVGMALVADDLVWIALGERWTPMVPLLRVLACYGLIRSLGALVPPLLYARYRPAFLFWWTAVLLVILPFAFWAGAASLGALGVALAWAVVYPLMSLWMVREALLEMEAGWGELWDCLRPIAGAVLMMSVGVLAVRGILPDGELPARLQRLLLAAGTGGLVYALAVLRWGGPLVREMANVAEWLFPRSRTLVAFLRRSVEV